MYNIRHSGVTASIVVVDLGKVSSSGMRKSVDIFVGHVDAVVFVVVFVLQIHHRLRVFFGLVVVQVVS
jgi:hypothetical protein